MKRSENGELSAAPAGLRWLVLGLCAAAAAGAPPYVGPSLQLSRRVEVADHVVPMVVIVVASVLAAGAGWRRPSSDPILLGAGLLVALAGFWMSATHLPLVVQAQRHEVPWLAATWHTGTSAAVLAVGLCWVARALAAGP